MKQLISFFAVMILSLSAAIAQQDVINPQVTLHTNYGDIRLELFPGDAPKSVENFLQYANDGFYSGTVFHRVISHFMIQGGGMTIEDGDNKMALTPKPTRDSIVNGPRIDSAEKTGTSSEAA